MSKSKGSSGKKETSTNTPNRSGGSRTATGKAPKPWVNKETGAQYAWW